jgi:hypothetical protein
MYNSDQRKLIIPSIDLAGFTTCNKTNKENRETTQAFVFTTGFGGGTGGTW